MIKRKHNDVFLELEKAQKLCGIVAELVLFILIVGIFLIPPPEIPRLQILGIFAFVLIFTVVYYNLPRLYLNPRLALLPDFVYLTGSAFAVMGLGKYGSFLLIYLYLLIMIDAYIFNLRQLLIVTVVSIILLNVVSFFSWRGSGGVPFIILIQTYSLIAIATVSRIFASFSLSMRDQKLQLENLNKKIIADKKESLDLIDSLGDGIISCDKDGKIFLHNKSAIELLDTKDLSGRYLTDVFSLYDEDRIAIDLYKIFDEKSPKLIRSDLFFKKKNNWYRFYIHLNPVYQGREMITLIILFRDITREKMLEERSTEFVAVASHEMRTPLAQIEGYLFLALKQLEGVEPNIIENVKCAHNSAVHLINLTNDILTVYNIDGKRINVALKKVNFGVVISTIIKSFETKAKEKHIEVSFKNKISKDEAIVTDESKIVQILTNLIQNAVKFTDKGWVRVTLSEDPRNLIVDVSDSGIGIESSARSHIFEKFYRMENWETRKTQGTGLGLYIVKNLTERLGGKVECVLNKKIGTTFRVHFPKEYKNEEDIKKASEEELKNFIGSF